MSQGSLDAYMEAADAINARHISDDAAERLLAPGFQMANLSTALTEKTYHGVDGAREWIRDTFEVVDESTRYEVDEILANGKDFVVARVGMIGHGARSGVPVAMRWVNVTWFQDGKMTRTGGCLTRREALEAVGQEG
jgi:ketosteroid isomerase-like protein